MRRTLVRLKLSWARLEHVSRRTRVLFLLGFVLAAAILFLSFVPWLSEHASYSYSRPNWVFPWSQTVTDHSLHQHFVYNSKRSEAERELGDCLNIKINWCFAPGNVRHPGGPRKVLNNLMSGLREIGVQWAFCDVDMEKYDVTFLVDMEWITDGDFHGLYNLWPRPTRVFLGPNVDFTRVNFTLIPKTNIDSITLVGASKWHALAQKEAFGYDRPYRWWPVGVDSECYQPENELRENVLLYQKRMAIPASTWSFLEKYPIEHFHYGFYRERSLRKALNSAKFALVFGVQETQGLAYLEMLSMDVPMMVVGTGKLSYFSNECGMVVKDEDEFMARFQEFVDNVENGVYTPRRWIVENLSLSVSAIDLLRMFCGYKTRWD